MGGIFSGLFKNRVPGSAEEPAKSVVYNLNAEELEEYSNNPDDEAKFMGQNSGGGTRRKINKKRKTNKKKQEKKNKTLRKSKNKTKSKKSS